MATEYRVLTVPFRNREQIKPCSVYQYDYGRLLRISGVDVPDYYEVHFGRSRNGYAKSTIGTSEGVLIPNEFLQTSGTLYAWFYFHDAETDGETIYTVKLDVEARGELIDELIDDTETSTLANELIGALSSGVEQSREILNEATEKANAAEQAANTVMSIAEEAESWNDQIQETATNTIQEITESKETILSDISTRGSELEREVESSISSAGESQLQSISEAGNAQASTIRSTGQAQLSAISEATTAGVSSIQSAGSEITTTLQNEALSQVVAVQQAGTTAINAVQTQIGVLVDTATSSATAAHEDALAAAEALAEISQYDIAIDDELSSESEHPVQNRIITEALSGKVDSVSGKGLSSNDFTDALKQKLDNIDPDATRIDVDSSKSLVSENPVQNKVLTAAMKTYGVSLKADEQGRIGLVNEDGADVGLRIAVTSGGIIETITVDSELSTTSTNPVQNRIIALALEEAGKTAYRYAVDDGYEGTEEEFYAEFYEMMQEFDKVIKNADSEIRGTTLFLRRGEVSGTTFYL